ncbi:MAG: fimbrillin family protein [Bacteroidales bacterium]|nr:fimbrillin family protein [Bacteroidales bacterium]
MNKLKNIAMIAFAGLALTACNNNEEPQIDNAKILKIEARICGEETRANTEENGDKFLPGDIIKIPEWLSGVRKYIPYITNEGTVNGVATFVPQSDDVIFGNFKEGYLDNGDERCTVEEFYLPEDQSTVEKLRKADWIVVDMDNWQAHQLNIKERTLNLSFEHNLTKVTVVISEYSNNMSNVNVGEVIPTDATMYSVPDDRLLNEDSNIEISPLITQDKTKGNHKFTAIVSSHCCWEEGKTILKFKFEDIDYIVKAKEKISRFPGKHIIINIKLNGKQTVSPSQVSVAEWENGGNYSTEVSNPN